MAVHPQYGVFMGATEDKTPVFSNRRGGQALTAITIFESSGSAIGNLRQLVSDPENLELFWVDHCYQESNDSPIVLPCETFLVHYKDLDERLGDTVFLACSALVTKYGTTTIC